MTESSPRTAVVTAMLLTATAGAAAQSATPTVHLIEEAAVGGAAAWILRAPLPGTVDQVGIAMTCDGGWPEVTVFLGAFPPASTPVQLAIRSAAGRVERFGPVLDHYGPRSGFHSPQLSDPDEVARFLDAALETGALVSNGYNSFWNRVAPARNREVRARMRACGAG